MFVVSASKHGIVPLKRQISILEIPCEFARKNSIRTSIIKFQFITLDSNQMMCNTETKNQFPLLHGMQAERFVLFSFPKFRIIAWHNAAIEFISNNNLSYCRESNMKLLFLIIIYVHCIVWHMFESKSVDAEERTHCKRKG